MSELEKMKSEFLRLVKENFEENFNEIIETIIEHFGEEYREIIEHRAKEINILFYIEPYHIKRTIESGVLSEEEKKLYRSLLTELEKAQRNNQSNKTNAIKDHAHTMLEQLAFKVIGNGEITRFLEDEDNYQENIIDNPRIANAINRRLSITLSSFATDDENRKHSLIVLPILDDRTIIHEIIHVLGYNEKEEDLKKSGLVVKDSYDTKQFKLGIEDIDEYFVEMEAREIRKKLLEKGIHILPKSYNYGSTYMNLDVVLDKLVRKNEKFFIKCTFTKDKDLLKETLGEELYRDIAMKVYKVGYGNNYEYLGKLVEDLSNELCETVSNKISH